MIPRCECEHLIFDHLLDSDGNWSECLYCDCQAFMEETGE